VTLFPGFHPGLFSFLPPGEFIVDPAFFLLDITN
jgi:hypothetical protein